MRHLSNTVPALPTTTKAFLESSLHFEIEEQ